MARTRPLRRYADPEVSDPCTGCEAWCCQTLVFNRGVPGDASQLEFLRYCLGFPGVEVGVSADSWAVIVRTTCRHLDGNRCSVFGTDERPLKCSYYDALSCGYRGHFGVPRPTDIVRISRDQFRLVADSIIFDDLGRIVAIPPLDVLRDRLEQAERATAGVSLLPSLVPAGGSTEAQGASAPQGFDQRHYWLQPRVRLMSLHRSGANICPSSSQSSISLCSTPSPVTNRRRSPSPSDPAWPRSASRGPWAEPARSCCTFIRSPGMAGAMSAC